MLKVNNKFKGYERVNNFLSFERGQDWTDWRGLLTICLIPVEKSRSREDFLEIELQHVWTGQRPVSSAIPEKTEVNED